MGYVTDLDLGPDGQLVTPAATGARYLAEDADDEENLSLCELLDRVLNKGVVVRGEVVITVADVELLYLGLELILCATETARQAGIRLPTDMTDARMLPAKPQGARTAPLSTPGALPVRTTLGAGPSGPAGAQGPQGSRGSPEPGSWPAGPPESARGSEPGPEEPPAGRR